MAKLTSNARNKLKSSTFGLPGSRRFPMPDKSHAANAKARATQGVNTGTLSPSSAAKIKAKANRILTGVDADLNAPGNRSPATPLQEDINPWKSKPVTTRGKWVNNSQGSGVAADSGKGSSKREQPKHGGTEVASASKKAQPKIGAGQTKAPISVAKKGQEKFGGTANKQSPVSGGGGRYANGSSSHDAMKTMIRDH